jgi:hypothetical protein
VILPNVSNRRNRVAEPVRVVRASPVRRDQVLLASEQ